MAHVGTSVAKLDAFVLLEELRQSWTVVLRTALSPDAPKWVLILSTLGKEPFVYVGDEPLRLVARGYFGEPADLRHIPRY